MMKRPIAAAAAACKVWTRSTTSPSIFGRSIYESLRPEDGESIVGDTASALSELSHSYHFDRMLVNFEEKNDGSVLLTPSTSETEFRTTKEETTTTSTYRGIPLGRAKDCPTLTSLAFEDDRLNRRRRPFVGLAVVGMVVITQEKEDSPSLLITRRPSYMRSFPGAFVFPGGNVDADDESLKHALSREIFEETGLNVPEDSWKLECLWESLYPTQLPPPEEEDYEKKMKNDGAIKAHHLVCYFSSRLKIREQEKDKTKRRLNLCKEEVDGAVMMSRNNIRDLLQATAYIEADSNRSVPERMKDKRVALQTSSTSSTAPVNDILLSDLAGIYPRLDSINSRYCGMAQGSLFALQEFVKNENIAYIN